MNFKIDDILVSYRNKKRNNITVDNPTVETLESALDLASSYNKTEIDLTGELSDEFLSEYREFKVESSNNLYIVDFKNKKLLKTV